MQHLKFYHLLSFVNGPSNLLLISPPQVAYGTTVALRFANNVIGGEQFVDLARWAGVQ